MDTATTPAPQPTNPASTDTLGTPNTWPGAFGLYKYSKAAVKFNLGTILTLTVLSIVASIVLSLFKVYGRVLSQLVSLILSVAFIAIYLSSARGQKIDTKQALQRCQPMLVLKYIVNALLIAVVLVISFLLLVVPFFFVLPRLLLAPYFLVDQNMGPITAMQASWRATKGHAGKIWGIIGATILMALLVFTIIGIPFAIYFLFLYQAAFAIAYDFIVARAEPLVAPDAAPMPAGEPSIAPSLDQ